MTAEGGVDPETLGRSTWTFLHTLAASQPQKLTNVQQERLKRFVTDFGQLYPCAPCAESFRDILDRYPVETVSGPKFSQWMCKVHNEVNAELGKSNFNCSFVGNRWGVCEQCASHTDELNQFKSMFRQVQKR